MTELESTIAATRRRSGSTFVFSERVIDYKTAIFRRLNHEYQCTNHDALEFPDGRIVLLTFLQEGQEPPFCSYPRRRSGLRLAQRIKMRRSRTHRGSSGEVDALPGQKPDPEAVARRDDPKAVVLNLMQPITAAGRVWCRHRQTGLDCRTRRGTNSERHASPPLSPRSSKHVAACG